VKGPTLFFAALAAPTAVAFGEPPHGPPIERLTQDLSLDATQAAQVKQIFEAEHEKMEAERARIDADLRQQLSTVLTAEELQKYDEIRKHRGLAGPPPGERGADQQEKTPR
jgi:hypothetical protein